MRASYIISSIVCCLLMLAYTEKQALAEDVSLDATPDTISPKIKRKTIVIVKRRPVKTESQGVQLGSFILTPTVSLAEYYDDNVYATDSGTKHDGSRRFFGTPNIVTYFHISSFIWKNWDKFEEVFSLSEYSIGKPKLMDDDKDRAIKVPSLSELSNISASSLEII